MQAEVVGEYYSDAFGGNAFVCYGVYIQIQQ